MFITGTLCKNWNRDEHKGEEGWEVSGGAEECVQHGERVEQRRRNASHMLEEGNQRNASRQRGSKR